MIRQVNTCDDTSDIWGREGGMYICITMNSMYKININNSVFVFSTPLMVSYIHEGKCDKLTVPIRITDSWFEPPSTQYFLRSTFPHGHEKTPRVGAG